MTGATSEWKTALTESVEAGACKAREQRRQRAGVGERYRIAVFSNWAAQGRAKHDRFVHRLLCAGVRGPATLAGTRELGHVHAHACTHTPEGIGERLGCDLLVEWDPSVGSAFIWKIWVCVGLRAVQG